MKRCLLFAVMVILNAAMISAQNLGTIVFQKGENGFDTYRIPAMVQAQDGTILAFAEARKFNRSDTGDIDLVLKRSTDGGKTWGEIITVWDDGGNVCGNPSPVVVSKTGRIVLLSTWNHGEDHTGAIRERTGKDTRRVYSMYSDDHGLTWSAPVEITSSVKLDEWTWYATGPCHALETSSGRLVVPCNHGISIDGKPAGSHSHVIYSDDMGETWHIGGCPEVGDESTVVELQDGSLMLNMRGPRDKDRIEKYGAARLVAVSRDGGLTFEPPYYEKGLIEPVCNGSIIAYAPSGKNTGKLIFSNPEHKSKRMNLTIKLSKNNGKTWERAYTVTEGPTAYSDLLVMKDGDVGVLYESGLKISYEYISFQRVPSKFFNPGPDETVLLYPEGQGKDKGIVAEGKTVTLGPKESNGFDRPEEVNQHGNVSYIGDSARVEIYLPHKPNGQMVIVCPGGGYSTVCAVKEGYDVAKWMNRRGIAVCVLYYRLPNGHDVVPLVDVHNAFRYCRANAAKWGVDQIGIMGFSAGGHLAASGSTLFVDEITRPDFSVLVYPVITFNDGYTHQGTKESLLGKNVKNRKMVEYYSLQNRVTEHTPPTYLVHCTTDKVVPIENSLDYYLKLKEKKVHAEMYVFPKGGHGWGFLDEEILGRKDGLGVYRPLFSETLESFLENMRKLKK
ncbi:MAG: exo-alpha-sialidase [Bacteroidales bacterium]|nr:exo-alpha-sialidase [Bacteroidales bacterium]